MKKLFEKGLSLLMSLAMVFMTSQPVFAASENVLRVMDTTAGTPAMVMVTGEPKEIIELTFTNPYKSVISQQFQLSDEGVLSYWYPQAVIAGEYHVAYKGQTSSFVVIPGLPDPQQSVLELTDYTAYVGDDIEGTLSLKDHYGNIIAGRAIELQTKGLAQLTCFNSCRSNQDGAIRFAMTSRKSGLEKLTVVDKEHDLKVFQEDIGFIPHVQQPAQAYTNPYMGYGALPYLSPMPTANSGYTTTTLYDSQVLPTPNFNFDYLPITDPTRATFDSQGNNDRFLSQGMEPQLAELLSANLLESNFIAQVDQGTTLPVVQNTGGASSLEILFGDPDADFDEQVTVAAQTAQDVTIRAVDSLGEVVTNYTGQIEFELTPTGLVPNDYTFSELDQGQAVFELALVLPVGNFSLEVRDKANPNVSGTVQITSQFEGIPNLNNTNIQLTIDSPVANSIYAKNFSVQGSTSTDNTEIIVKEGPLELKRGKVDENKAFNFILDLSDGNHTLEVTAIYLPDGSETKATIPLEVDKTPPVITSVSVPDESVRAGESFVITAEAEERSDLQVFINNRSYDLTDKGNGQYELTATAPLDPGSYPVHARAVDELGNVTDSPSVGTLTVVPGRQEISNLFGIPGVGTITLSWNAVEGAVGYDVSYQSILGQSQQQLETAENRITVQDLAPNLSYIFTVVAKDATGAEISQPTKSKAIKVLAAPAAPTDSSFTEPPVATEPTLRPAADVVTAPARHTKSGPEVYLLILASLIVLNLYGRARRALAIRD